MRKIVIVLATLAAIVFVACLKPAGIRYPELPRLHDGALYVIVFDVGQSDAFLVIYQGKTLLIDAGTTNYDPHRVANRVPRRLEALTGKRHLDHMIVTHYHADHFGTPGGDRRGRRRSTGLYAMLEREGLTIDTLIDRGSWTLNGKQSGTHKNYERHVRQWLDTGVVKQRREARPGDLIDMGDGLEVRVITSIGNGQLDRLKALFPTLMEQYPPSENDYSVGVKITLGDFELFTGGDLSGRNSLRQYGPMRESYNDLESRIAGEIGAVEIYRVNHHGSANSTNDCFAAVLNPQVSIFSAGENRYGHPDPGVVKRLKQYGDIWVTGGADPRVKPLVGDGIVGDDIDIVVSPDGARFWLNGVEYRSLSDAEEATRAGIQTQCDDTIGESHIVDDSPVRNDILLD